MRGRANVIGVLKVALAVAVIALALFGDRLFPVLAVWSPLALHGWLEAAGALAPLVFVGLMATAVVISPLPSLPLDVAAGSFFGPLLGTVYAVVGALLGAVLSFLIARLLGRQLVERLVGGHINLCRQCSDRLLTRIVFLARLIPFVSFDVVSYGAGLTNMSLGRFAIATGLGMLPLTALYVSFGAVVVTGRVVPVGLALGFVAVFFLLPRWIERHDLFKMRRHFEHGAEG